jgi:hypothetical protein
MEAEMLYKSLVEAGGEVRFPEFLAERVYMREFHKEDGLPSDLSRWQGTVDDMLLGVDTDGPIYIMIDQSVVGAGKTQRRPGLHIDGYWRKEIQAHGNLPTHSGMSASSGRWDVPTPTWGGFEGAFSDPEGIILASDVPACQAISGQFSGDILVGGDCSGVAFQGEAIRFEAGRAYAGNVTMLHESLPLAAETPRTLVRLNVPGWSIN